MGEKTYSLDKFKVLNGSWLKIITVISMFMDHFACTVLKEFEATTSPLFMVGSKEITLYYIFRKIGRIAFPIFCFLLVEGFIHTKNRKKYGTNLLILAFVSEIPFDLMVGEKFFYFERQNVCFTLFLGFLALCIIENIKNPYHKLLLLTAIVFVSNAIKVDYGENDILLMIFLYVFREQYVIRTTLSFAFLSGGYAAWTAFLPITMYNGKRGFIKGKILKYWFYVFYPLHIIILVLIRDFIIRA